MYYEKNILVLLKRIIVFILLLYYNSIYTIIHLN
jgi:hypothetical protein